MRTQLRASAVLGAGGLLLVGNGCGTLANLFDLLQGPQTTTVELRNQGNFPVEVTLFFDDDQEVPEDLIQETGSERNFTIAPGEAEIESRSCDELQAIIIEDADLRVVGGIGPDASTDLLRDGDDFGCGDTIVFTFDHSELVADFDVTVRVIEQ